MKYRQLGDSDLRVPIVCMGTMTMGQQNDEAESFALLDHCLEAGVNFLDTAELYPVPPNADTTGASEEIIGRWMKSRGCRDKVILATKVASLMPGLDRSFLVANRHQPKLADAPQPALDARNIRDALEASLRRLQTSYVDLYQIHWPARYVPAFGVRQYRLERERDCPPFEEVVSTIGELIEEGKIRHWGLSNESTYGVCQMCETARRLGVPLPISIQNDHSLVYRPFDMELAEACSPRHYNIGLICYGALAGGTLSGKYLDGAKPPKARHTLFPNFQPRYLGERTAAAAKDYAELAARKGMTPAKLALAWAASRWFMASVIIGATTVEQLKENIEACNTELDEETIKEVDALFLKHGNTNMTD